MRSRISICNSMAKFQSDVTIDFNSSKINAKSLLNIIAACIKCGSEFVVECNGPDEEEALAKAVELIEADLVNKKRERVFWHAFFLKFESR